MWRHGRFVTALALVLACGGKKEATASPDDSDAKQSRETKKEVNEDLADLRALKKQGSFEEMLAKATEVKPTARDGEWEELLETAAVGFLQQLAKKEDEGAEMAPVEAADRIVELYPFLSDRKEFRKIRAETGVDAYRRCWNSRCKYYNGWQRDIDWSRAVHKYAEIDPEFSAFIAGKMVMTRLIATTATGMFALAVEHNGKKVCADGDLKKSVNEARREGEWNDEVAQITKVCGG
jgi:hypothetical protein